MEDPSSEIVGWWLDILQYLLDFEGTCLHQRQLGRPISRLPRAAAGRDRTELVFTAPRGGPVTDELFRNRVWYPAVGAAGIRRFPPRVMRHTAASWLVQDGVPLYDVQALLGHEDYATTQRYAHLTPDAHGKVLESWSRRSSSGEAGAG